MRNRKRRIFPRRRTSWPGIFLPLIQQLISARRAGLPVLVVLVLFSLGHFASGGVVGAAGPAGAQQASVVLVHDGDTITVAIGSPPKQRRVRLNGIDAPEHDQPGGPEARAMLKRLLPEHMPVRIEEQGEDAYGRLLAVVWTEGNSVNAELIRTGHAWVYRRYNDSAADIAAEAEARSARFGLWQAPFPTPPWEWRRKR